MKPPRRVFPQKLHQYKVKPSVKFHPKNVFVTSRNCLQDETSKESVSAEITSVQGKTFRTVYRMKPLRRVFLQQLHQYKVKPAVEFHPENVFVTSRNCFQDETSKESVSAAITSVQGTVYKMKPPRRVFPQKLHQYKVKPSVKFHPKNVFVTSRNCLQDETSKESVSAEITSVQGTVYKMKPPRRVFPQKLHQYKVKPSVKFHPKNVFVTSRNCLQDETSKESVSAEITSVQGTVFKMKPPRRVFLQQLHQYKVRPSVKFHPKNVFVTSRNCLQDETSEESVQES
ncbi:hypothetical protein J6590_076907 [Homalodisca vitripennis]|nr:hypothetical protein J6590_076907 [Homalodisca vitripennis]